MRIVISDQHTDSLRDKTTDYHLANMAPDQSTEVVPTPPVRIKGVDAFRYSYVQDEELRAAIRIRD